MVLCNKIFYFKCFGSSCITPVFPEEIDRDYSQRPPVVRPFWTVRAKSQTGLARPKIDLRENLSYFGFFLLNRTSEKCHTQQLQTHHALCSSQPLQSCPRSHARPARPHKPPHAKSAGSTSMSRVADPLGESEMHRVCYTCLSSRGRETSGADTAVGMKYSSNT